MNTIDFPIERINKYLDNHIFEVYLQPTHDEDYSVPTNVKVKLTGVKDYLTMGDKYPHVQYTITILPTNKESDALNKMWGSMYGKVLPITTSGSQYSELRWIMNEKLSDFLQYFGVEKKAICTEVVNELAEDKLNESLILEGKLDKLTRKLVQELKSQRAGFNKRVKTEKADFESLVRHWFKKNPHKHTLKPNQQEKVIQQIINDNV